MFSNKKYTWGVRLLRSFLYMVLLSQCGGGRRGASPLGGYISNFGGAIGICWGCIWLAAIRSYVIIVLQQLGSEGTLQVFQNINWSGYTDYPCASSKRALSQASMQDSRLQLKS